MNEKDFKRIRRIVAEEVREAIKDLIKTFRIVAKELKEEAKKQ